MARFRPRVGKVQVNPGNLTGSEDFSDIACIHTDETDIVQILKFFGIKAFYGAQKYAGVTFDPDIIDVWVSLCHIQKKLSFSHADLNLDGIGIAEKRAPFSFLLFGMFDDQFMRLQGTFGAWDVA